MHPGMSLVYLRFRLAALSPSQVATYGIWLTDDQPPGSALYMAESRGLRDSVAAEQLVFTQTGTLRVACAESVLVGGDRCILQSRP